MGLKKFTHPSQFIDFPQHIHPERLFVLRHLGENPDRLRVVDVGCGSHKTLTTAVGVDVREVTDFKAPGDRLLFLQGNSVDAIISRHSLEHILDQVAAFREWIRVLEPGGKLIVVLPDHGFVDTMDPFLSSGEHVHAYSRESFTSFVQLFPLKLETVETVIPEWSFGAVLTKIATV